MMKSLSEYGANFIASVMQFLSYRDFLMVIIQGNYITAMLTNALVIDVSRIKYERKGEREVRAVRAVGLDGGKHR